MKRSLVVGAMASLVIAITVPAFAQKGPGTTVSLSMFEARVRAFAPGVEAIITLSDDQKKKLGGIYDEVFGTPAVRLASSVLEDINASVGQRQMAAATVQQAQAAFRAKSRTVFTGAQRELIDRVYATFSHVSEQAEANYVKEMTGNLAKELDKILTPEQKQAMAKRQAEQAAAAKPKAATPEPPGAPAPGGQPGKPN
jgi:hypothetical protein